jgi:ABC-type nitrate/sulfonate/bicarbonate transport system substrate-binding protein
MRDAATRRRLLALAAASAGAASFGLAGSSRTVRAQGAVTAPGGNRLTTEITVNTFPGLSNYSIFAAEHKGLFTKQALSINLVFTPNSRAQRDGLEKGDYQIIQTAADNSIAMVELDNAGAAIVAGGDNGFNHIIVQPEINQLADVRGKTVVVDAPNTHSRCCSTKRSRRAGSARTITTSKPSARPASGSRR